MGVASGQTEPTWIAARGALVYEDASVGTPGGPTYPPAPSNPTLPGGDRYNNPGGNRPRRNENRAEQ